MDSSSDQKAILEKLDVLIRLQASLAVSSLEAQKDKILFLSKAGIAPKDIAAILDTSSNTVNVTLSQKRKSIQKSKNKN